MNKKFNCFPYFRYFHYLPEMVARIILPFALQGKGLRALLTPSDDASDMRLDMKDYLDCLAAAYL